MTPSVEGFVITGYGTPLNIVPLWQGLGFTRHQPKGTMGTRRPILIFQYSERIKSELIIASELLAKMLTLKGDELADAKKVMIRSL